MRQYFTKDKGGGQQPKHVKQWVKKQQETDPCFLCGKLGQLVSGMPAPKKDFKSYFQFVILRQRDIPGARTTTGGR